MTSTATILQSQIKQKHDRIFNFSAGPAALPLEVLEEVQSELLNFKGSGLSIMEMSHRGKFFDKVMEDAEQRLHKLMELPDHFAVLFLQGGATFQFSMVPMNFCPAGGSVDFVHTGMWTKKAIEEFEKLGKANIVASGKDVNFTKLPVVDVSKFSPTAAYQHYCTNNTIFGTQWKKLPARTGVRRVADMSSEILSRKFDYTQFDLVFAGSQKNIGPAGLAVVAIDKNWANEGRQDLPSMMQYRAHIENGSRLNTPPTFGIYIAGLVFKWIENKGGIVAMEKLNQEKADLLYNAIDSMPFYSCPIEKSDRSPMNVVFRLSSKNESLEDTFAKEAESAGLSGLKGHRSIGGLRASIYNAHPIEGVKALIGFMKDFEKKHG